MSLPDTSPRTAPSHKGKPSAAFPVSQPSGRDASLLLGAGLGLLVTGVISVLLIHAVFGGIDQHGARTNDGWLLLVLAMFCLPLGTLFSLIGGAKWVKYRRERHP